MEESYSEGLASHAGPEPCGGVREDVSEASVGVRAGRVISREICVVPGADAFAQVGSKPSCTGGRQPSTDEGAESQSANHAIEHAPAQDLGQYAGPGGSLSIANYEEVLARHRRTWQSRAVLRGSSRVH